MNKNESLFYLVINTHSGEVLSKGIATKNFDPADCKHIVMFVPRSIYEDVQNGSSRTYYWDSGRKRAFYRNLSPKKACVV